VVQLTGNPRQCWIPSRLCTEQLNCSEIELLYILTMGTRPTYHPIGSTLDPGDPTARLEVCVVTSHRQGKPPVIYVTKYCGHTVGERSVGLHPDVALDIAAMLRAAVSMCRDEQLEHREGKAA
jgi:hypothetical protein